jgi:hypothetical protein
VLPGGINDDFICDKVEKKSRPSTSKHSRNVGHSERESREEKKREGD